MPATVLLKDIVDALEILDDESLSFVDRDTGEVETVSRELLGLAEESEGDENKPELPAWQETEWEMAKRIAASDRFERLPTKFDVHEWGIMEEFSLSVESEKIRVDLLNAIRGAGAFRYFKDTIRRYGIEADWYAFRAGALRQVAIDWCEENEIAWK